MTRARIGFGMYRVAASAAASGVWLAAILVFSPPAFAQDDTSSGSTTTTPVLPLTPVDAPPPPQTARLELREEHGGVLTFAAGVSTSTFVLLQGVDIAQTMHCVGAANCHEVNPFLRSLSHNPTAFGATKMAIAFASGYALFHERTRHPKLVLVLSVAGASLYGTITYRQAKFGK